MKNLLLSVSLCFFIAGCSTTVPPIREYTIVPPSSSTAVSSPLSVKSLGIAPTRSFPSLASKNLYYIRSNGETGAYLYSRWSDTPSGMLQRFVTASLDNARIFAELSPSSSAAQADWILESELESFYHRFDNEGRSEGVIEITYRIVESKTKRQIASKRFSVTSVSASNDATGGVGALNDAARELSRQCTLWLKTLVLEKK